MRAHGLGQLLDDKSVASCQVNELVASCQVNELVASLLSKLNFHPDMLQLDEIDKFVAAF